VSETIELEASLRELWRRKWLVLAGAALAAVIAGAFTLATPAHYQTTTIVKIGRVMGTDLDDSYAVAEMVKSAGFQLAAQARAEGTRVAGRVSAQVTTGGQGRAEHPVNVAITGSGETPHEAVAAGQAAVDELIARHAEIFSKTVASYREYEQVLAAAAEPPVGPADPIARRELWELRAGLNAPIKTAETRAEDPFPVPSAPVPRNTAMAAAVAFASVAAVLALLVLALAPLRPEGGSQ
jgi:hypothetical protein